MHLSLPLESSHGLSCLGIPANALYVLQPSAIMQTDTYQQTAQGV
jgi:hypothetical protein